MSDLLSMANSIKVTKEEIRTILNNRGISVSANTKFDQYPAKIDMLGRVPGSGTTDDNAAEILTVKNDTGSTLQEGDKVFLYCGVSETNTTKVEFNTTVDKAYKNSTIASRRGDYVVCAGTNTMYDVAANQEVGSGQLNTTESVYYNHIYYMNNNVMITGCKEGSIDCYLLFPNQFYLAAFEPIRKNFYASGVGTNPALIQYNPLTGELVKFSGGFYGNGEFRRGSYDEAARYHGWNCIVDNYLFTWKETHRLYRYAIDLEFHSIPNEQTDIGLCYLPVNVYIGTTADDKYSFFTDGDGKTLNVCHYDSSTHSLTPLASVFEMCHELAPYYNSSTGNYKFSFNEFTGNLHVITLTKFLVFHYENDAFTLILNINLDFSTELCAPSISDDLDICAGGKIANKWYCYKIPSVIDESYKACIPGSKLFNNDIITGIVHVGGSDGSMIQVRVPKYNTIQASLTTPADNAEIEQL